MPKILILVIPILVMLVLGCSGHDNVGGKTTTTTNGLAIRFPDGSVPGKLSARIAKETWDYGTDSILVIDLQSDDQGVFEISTGDWAVLQIMNTAGDSGVWLQDFNIAKDSVLQVNFEPLITVRETLGVSVAGLPVFLRGGIQSTLANEEGIFELSQVPTGAWQTVSRDSQDVIRGVLYASGEDTEFARALGDYVPNQKPAALLVDDFSDGDLDAFPGGEVPGAFWDLFESGAVLVQPADLSEEELLQSFTDSGTIQIEYEEFLSGSWVALSLSWPGRMDVRQLDSVCINMASNGNMKVEFVSPKIQQDTQAPGFYQELSAVMQMNSYCLYPAQWTAANTNPDSLLVWDDFAQSVSAFQILGRSGSTRFEVDQIEFYGPVFLRDE